MARRLIHALPLAAAAWLLATGAAPSPALMPAEPPALPPVQLAELRERLASLDPANPNTYFLLGEEVLAEAGEFDQSTDQHAATIALAQRLFVLAFTADQSLPAEKRQGLGRSVCLALATTARDDGQRRWLWAMARSLDRGVARSSAPPQKSAAAPPVSDDLALDVCNAIGYVRAGEGRRAEATLQRPAASALLDRYDRLLSPVEMTGTALQIRRMAQQWPVCPECKNKRIVGRPGDPSSRPVLCLTCRGNPGPRLSDADLLAQLRFEAVLLSGVQRSWSAQVAVDNGAPLRDLEPAELAPAFGIDPTLLLWRDGSWVAPAKPPPPPSKPRTPSSGETTDSGPQPTDAPAPP